MDNETLNTVEYLLRARTVELGKQLLLANSSDITFISRQWLGKHVLMASEKHATIEVLLETVFSNWPLQRDYKKDC
jgi:hypothetical protein